MNINVRCKKSSLCPRTEKFCRLSVSISLWKIFFRFNNKKWQAYRLHTTEKLLITQRGQLFVSSFSVIRIGIHLLWRTILRSSTVTVNRLSVSNWQLDQWTFKSHSQSYLQIPFRNSWQTLNIATPIKATLNADSSCKSTADIKSKCIQWLECTNKKYEIDKDLDVINTNYFYKQKLIFV